MGIQVIYVFTHDSILLGEDGPTHQPVEQVAALRAVPNLLVLRPADGWETAAAWALALERREGPTAILLTRQPVPVVPRPAGCDPSLLRRGGYVLSEVAGDRPLVLIATGSEVAAAIEAQALLQAKGLGSRVVSMPCREAFLREPEEYRESVVPRGACTVVIEAAVTMGWERVAGHGALLIGVDRFGASAPWQVMQDKFGLTGRRVAEAILRFLGR
jgi:transketolase